MNKWIGMGRLVRNPEVRWSQGSNSMQIARYTLAVDRKFKREGEQTADFISCVAFGKAAEFAEKYFHKGTKIVVEGRIQTGSYEKDGQRIYTTDIVVESQEFAESKQNSNAQQSSAPEGQPTPSNVGDGFMNIPDGLDEELPFT